MGTAVYKSSLFCFVLLALAGVAQLVGALSHNWKVVGSIPGQVTYLGCGFDPLSGRI